ncbi:DUF7504 family protein [Natrinema salsiterrestre]|uniref:Halobacterial output domain-containing protein n=1 Tax=Natrinema salsiterrestre TaxID=2950540 RepID=A0A9Q4L7K0_9EURY|nr:hypothetical protein [Natrinema salsiterrestre]MDF9747410.1 hypothetical protein [Natrinema salsiterrestre]
MEPTTPAAIDPPANVLLVHSRHDEPDACEALCHDDGGTAHLTVTFNDEVPAYPDGETVDRKLGLLTVGNVLTDDGAESVPDFTEPVVSDTVPDPTDLSEIGVAVSRFCKHWAETDEEITVCFDSLDALLRHTSPKDVFQFTHVLTNRLSSVDAYAHCHFDPTRHEDRVVSTFGTIFDSVVVADDADDSLPEATDDEVASLLAEWEDESAVDLTPDPDTVTEATDEEIAQMLGK